jgi:hypothetical protein
MRELEYAVPSVPSLVSSMTASSSVSVSTSYLPPCPQGTRGGRTPTICGRAMRVDFTWAGKFAVLILACWY